MPEKRNIIILGAGFGGLRTAILAAKKLRKLKLENKYEVILIDRNDYHTYTPLLYETATTSKETANYPELKNLVTFSIKDVVGKYPVKFIHNKVETLDLINGDIHCAGGAKLKYDYLVLALGSETNYFGIPGLKENALPLKTFIDALAIRNRILNAVSEGRKNLQILIGGGGTTGVELAGEIQEWLCELREERANTKCDARVTIIEAAPSILPGFEQKIINLAQQRLKKLGTQILLNEAVAGVQPNKITLKSNRELPYDILIWTGGIKTAGLTQELPLKKEERKYQITTLEGMDCLPSAPNLKLYGKIYGLGDAICFYDPETKKPIPKVARAALIQAGVVAHNIIADIKLSKPKSYEPKEYPYVIPVGGKYAIAKIGSFIVAGFWGWVLKGLVELNYLISIMPFWKAVKIWLKGLWVFIKNDRLG